MTATHDSHDEVPAPEPAPVLEAGPGEDAYSASDEEEITARLEALGYLE